MGDGSAIQSPPRAQTSGTDLMQEQWVFPGRGGQPGQGGGVAGGYETRSQTSVFWRSSIHQAVLGISVSHAFCPRGTSSLVGKMLKQSIIKCDTCFEDACHSGCGMTEEVFLEEVMFKQ